MSFHRAYDGRSVLYCRPGWVDCSVSRRESWDPRHWSEPYIAIDQEPGDHPQTQFYGLGAIPYGPSEIGTLWCYHTDAEDMGFWKMHGHHQPGLVCARSGYAWHHAELGRPWIPLGQEDTWEWGGIQPASAPMLRDGKIRFYYVAICTEHGAEAHGGPNPRCGLGLAWMKPDRFVGVTSPAERHILTRAFWTETPEFYINADMTSGGQLWAEVQDLEGSGSLRACRSVSRPESVLEESNSVRSHGGQWIRTYSLLAILHSFPS
jgi:hypothetical protein